MKLEETRLHKGGVRSTGSVPTLLVIRCRWGGSRPGGEAGNTTAAVPAAGWASRGLMKCFKNILQEMGGQGQTLSCFVLFLDLLSLPNQAVGVC